MPAHLTDAGMRHGECVWVLQVIVDAMLDVTPRRSGDRPRNKGVNDAGVVGLPSAFVRTRSARTSLALVGSARHARCPPGLGALREGGRVAYFSICSFPTFLRFDVQNLKVTGRLHGGCAPRRALWTAWSRTASPPPMTFHLNYNSLWSRSISSSNSSTSAVRVSSSSRTAEPPVASASMAWSR